MYGTLSRNYLLVKKSRSLITILGITLGVTMIVAVTLTNAAILSRYTTLLEGIAGRSDLQVIPHAGQGFPESFLDEVESVPGVETAVPSVFNAAPVFKGERQVNAAFYGVDPDRDRLIRDHRLEEGRFPAARREAAVTRELAAGLGLKMEDQMRLLSTSGLVEFRVVGVLDTRGTARGALGPFGLLQLADAQQVFGKIHKLDSIDILVSDHADKLEVEQTLKDRLSGRARVGTPLERSRDMQKLLDSIIFALSMAGSIALLAGSFIIYTNVSMGVAERRRDLSILRALGMRRREIMTLVLTEAGLMGLLGSLIGLAWGYGLADTLVRELAGQFLVSYGIQPSRVALNTTAVILGLAVGIITSLVAAGFPARQAIRISPLEAMRPSDLNGVERNGPARGLLGLAMVVAGVTFTAVTWPTDRMFQPLLLRAWGMAAALMLLGAVVGLPTLLSPLNRYLLRPLLVRIFGITGRIAADNLLRQPRRTAATICALLVSLAYMVTMGGMKTSQIATFDRWFEKTVGWDLNVSTSFAGLETQVEMDPALVAELELVPGVRLVSPQKMGRLILGDGDPAFLQAFDHRKLRLYSEYPMEQGRWAPAMDDMVQGGAAMISPAVSLRLGVKPGDLLPLPTPAGEKEFRVVGVFKDVTPYGGTVQIDRQDYVRYWQDQTSSNVAVLVTEKTRVEEIRRAILDRWGERMPLAVRSNREFWAEIRSQYEAAYRLMDVLIWIAVLVSGLAIANTLFASVMERRREFGVLRAVGSRRREVMQVVVGEAFSTGLVGGFLGIACGLVLQVYMVQTNELINGAAVDFMISWSTIATSLLVALILAPLVGMLPARRAARLDVVEALQYE
ncbi:MAG: ABC transporter permease [Firmicutes bacterium]|nr:ABC transporter permease [Bacillota bacterium]